MSSCVYNNIISGLNYLASYVYKEEKEPARLDVINQLWLSTYSQRKTITKDSLEKKGPVILLNGDDLILRYQGKREIYQYVPKEYHELKSIAHIACLIHTILMLRQGKITPLDIVRKEEQARLLLNKIQLVGNLQKYQPLIEEYKVLLERKEISQLYQLKGSLDELIDDAAKCRLDSLHKTTELVRSKIEKKDWEKVAVIVMGPQMPRKGELGTQYYDSILDTKNRKLQCPYQMQLDPNLSKQRLIYAESIYDEDTALGLLTTHICDEDVGEDLLGNKNAMHWDILKNATTRHLEQLHT